jgi:hypothetical protein
MLENKPAKRSHEVWDYIEKRDMVTGEIRTKKNKTKEDWRKMWFNVL